MDLELWGNDGKRDIKLCEVSNRQYGAIIGEALWRAHRVDQPDSSGFRLARIWLRDLVDPRNPRILDHWPEEWSVRTLVQAARHPGEGNQS